MASPSAPTPALSHCKCHCDDSACPEAIQKEYDSLITAIKTAADRLPRHKPGVEKSWWNESLTQLKQQSVEIHRLWISEGKLHHGPTNEERLRVSAAYKRAIKTAQKAPKQAQWNRLHDAMASNETDDFWKSWRSLYNKNKSHLPPVVNGVSSKEAIADSFQQHFEKVAKPNNKQKVDEINQRFNIEYEKKKKVHEEECTCHNYSISIETVVDAVFSLKSGKSEDDDGITAEHFLNAPFAVIVRLHHLFNAMLRHSFVPAQFKLGSIIPIIKDHQGNLGDLDNYRGITISPIPSKIFEHALKIVFGNFLSSSPLQFGFKSKSSTAHALYSLKETVDYYINNGSRVYCAFLDASKAFDRLVHTGLFLKLMSKGVPLIFINLLLYWYKDLMCRVRWGESLSKWYFVLSGVRQGGVLSPDLYCLYVDDLLKRLEALNVGCYIMQIFLAALLYADDMALMAPSVKGLCLLLKECNEFCIEWDICLNTKKSKLMYFGKKCTDLFTPLLNGEPIEWVASWKYLGVTLVSGRRFGCSTYERIRKFYRCANAIFRVEGRSDDLAMLRLVESHCVPLLTYGMEICHFSDSREASKIRAAYNSLFRRIFNYRNYESVTELQLSLARPTWELLIEDLKVAFFDRVSQCGADSPIHVFSII